MLKLLQTSAFYKDSSEPEVTFLTLSSKEKGLEKIAAHQDIKAFVDQIVPKEGHSYLHINAMTAGEWYSSNRNGDFFPEENLKKYYKTFETSPAYVYRSHINKDPARSYGKVIFAVYNEAMHRVELIAECPDDLIADVTKRIAMGDFPTTSMACKTPYDTCSVCGNVARTRNEYCPHLRSQLNKLFPDGKKVFAINNGPLTFFDISIVIRPADVNSSILQKVAYDGSTIGSAELAEIEGLTEESLLRKKAEFKKFSELIKEIGGGEVIGAGKNSEEILNRTHDLPRDLVEVLCEYDLPQVLVSMADLGISPSINFLSELIVRKHLGQGYDGIGQYVEEFVKTIPASESVPAIRFEEPTEINPSIKPLLVNNVIGSSLLPDYVEKRSMYQIPPSYASMSAQPRPRVSGVGYAGLGPYVEPTQKELDMEYAHSQEHEIGAEQSFFKDYSKLLTSVGVTALLAKFFITQMMYNRVKRKFDSELQHNQNGVKIVLVKQASDYSVAHSLSKIALDQSLPRPLESDSGLKTQVLSKGTSILRDKLIASRTNLGSKLGTLLHYVGIGAKLKSKIETKGN